MVLLHHDRCWALWHRMGAWAILDWQKLEYGRTLLFPARLCADIPSLRSATGALQSLRRMVRAEAICCKHHFVIPSAAHVQCSLQFWIFYIRSDHAHESHRSGRGHMGNV